MNFNEELAAKVMAGEKTVTRRMPSENPRSPWYIKGCKYKPGRDYAVCPGRGQHSIGRIVIVSAELQQLATVMKRGEAKREGLGSVNEFWEVWRSMHGRSIDPEVLVWRVAFELMEAPDA